MLVQLVIHRYYKSSDTVTLSFDKNQKQFPATSIASYIHNPQGVMNLKVAFDKLSGGTNHDCAVTLEGVS